MGAGNLGLALADYPGFRTEGFEIAALFDSEREKIGQRSRGGVPIHDIRDVSQRSSAASASRIAVIAVPAASAQAVVNKVVAAGIKAVLNFSPGDAEGAAGREAEERGPDGVAREPVVLPGARRGEMANGRGR